jgi:coenzyme F420 hydrogenase subunit beta
MEVKTFVPLMERSKGFQELKRLIVDQGLCSRCGSCAAFCERLEMTEQGPELVKECVMETDAVKCGDLGTCLDNCPILSYSYSDLDEKVFGAVREDRVLGHYRKIVAARSTDKAVSDSGQDGGAVTALLLCALEEGLIEGAVVAKRSDDWVPEAVLAKTRDDILASVGTKYSSTPSVTVFGRNLNSHRRLAIVGTGCQITGLKKAETGTLKVLLDKKKESDNPFNLVSIGLFCYENFMYSKFKAKVAEEFGVKLEDMVKNDIIKGKIFIHTRDGKEHVKPVKVFNDIVEECCLLCEDFTSSFADISVGSVGSGDGWSTVIVRSQKGEELLNKAVEKGYLEVTEGVRPEFIKKTEASKVKKREATRERREKEGKYLPSYG